jgi:hypothetical protein
MYRPIELARFALSEFQRGLEGLTDEEARVRLTKADGSHMNAVSWTVGHIAGHWLLRPPHLDRYNFRSNDPTPPSLEEARQHLQDAKAFVERWLPSASDELLSRLPPDNVDGETVGTGLMRMILHTWFHAGEINAIRQMLGHAEITYVGRLLGNLEWRSGPDA